MILCSSVLLICKSIFTYNHIITYPLNLYICLQPGYSFTIDRGPGLDPTVPLGGRMQFSTVHVRLRGPKRTAHVETVVSRQ